MNNVLVINSSLNGKAGNSNKASEHYIDQLKKSNESIKVTELDLNSEGLPHLSIEEMQAWSVPADDRDAVQTELASFSDRYIKLIQQADKIVLAVPMYNFDSPSVLKAFFDRIARVGITFKYTEQGPIGLIKDKQVVVLAARGGKYQGTELDTQSSYLSNFLAFLGMTQVKFHYIEGLAMGEESAKSAWENFFEEIIEPKAILED